LTRSVTASRCAGRDGYPRQLADLLHTNEQIIRGWVREGILPAHRKLGGRKLSFLRHEIFEWLISNRYEPESDHQAD
jgi:predicted DNA-binding transcriptional regulator AlpA